MSQANSFERQMLDLINQERTSRGIDPLQLELRLNDSAEDYSQLMLQQDFFSHTGPGGTSPTGRMQDAGFVFSGSWASGENLAWQSERGAPGLADDVVNLHNNLMNSSGHRANILNPNFEVIGIGIEAGDLYGWDAVIVTQNFAKTGASVQIDGGNNGGGGGGNPTPPPNPNPPSDDPIVGTSGDDRLTGSSSDDVIRGKRGNDDIQGGSGNDILRGHKDNDNIDGGSGNDTIYGNRHNDTLDGGSGNDVLRGAHGADTFVFSAGNDRVVDFDTDQNGERIDLSDVNSISSFADLQANHLSSSGGNAVISDGYGNTMTLQDVNVYALDAGDFLF